MQLTLSSVPFAKPRVALNVAAPTPHPRHASALSQLDQIAAQNLQATRQGLGGSAMVLALLGGLVILGSASMWNSGSDEPRKRPAAAERPDAQVARVAEAPTVSMAAAPPAMSAVAAPAVVAAPVQAAEPALEPVRATAAAADSLALADDARKARAKQQAEARRKAAQLAQERTLAEETQRLQLAQQREAERAQQQAEQARQRAAAEQTRLASVQVAGESRRHVGDMCSTVGGFISQQFCHARECRKAEHQGDGICVNLRETEAARLRASAER